MCKKCETHPVYEFTNKRKLCKDCFIKYFQKKVFYTIRKFGLIKKDECVAYGNGNGFREVVLRNVLHLFSGKAPINLIKKSSKKKYDKLAVASTTDLESEKILEGIIKGDVKKIKFKPVEGKIIKPLYWFLDEEVLLYAKLLGLKVKEEKTGATFILDSLEREHPEIKRAIVKGFLEMSN